jgi:DNA-binding NarL/FixJ family response regulator
MTDTKTREAAVVWVVEDNDRFRKQLVTLLNMSTEFRCEEVFRAAEPALTLLQDGSPPDLILMDIGLPGIDGVEGVRRVKAIAPAVQVVILTVFDDNENVVRAIAAGASGYLHKSSSLEEIISALGTILDGGAPINPQLARKMLEYFSAVTAPAGDYHLTVREKEILTSLVEDLSQKQIADRLCISAHTVNMHLRNIYGKLQVQSKAGAVAKVLKERLL